MQQYFLDYPITSEKISFNEEQQHHLTKVLRMQENTIVKVVDSAKKAFLVALKYDGKTVYGQIQQELEYTYEKVEINLFMGMLKKDKWDYMIQKCCELGVTNIIPVVSKRCVVKTNDKTSKKMERYNKIALEACEQCKRDTIVKVLDPCNLKEIPQFDLADVNVIAYEDSDIQGLTLKKVLDQNVKSINIVIGPEGGFDQDEVTFLMDHNYKCISLGKRILRAETAAISSISNIMFYFEEE